MPQTSNQAAQRSKDMGVPPGRSVSDRGEVERVLTKMDPRDGSYYTLQVLAMTRRKWEASEERRQRGWDVMVYGCHVVATRVIFRQPPDSAD